MVLTNSTIQIVKQTAPVLAEHGTTITSTMYRNMFSHHPTVKTFFNMQHQVPSKGEKVGAQAKSLAQAVHAYAENIDNLGVLGPAIERIAEKHVSLFVKPEHYDIVGSELIGAIKEVLQESATPDIISAWTEAYQFLAKVFIDKEQELATEKATNGGWFDLKEFSIQKLVPETSEITSFYLSPKDGSPMISTWKAGQYVGIRHKVGNEDVQRNYSISCTPGSENIRLTIKKECPNGSFSSQLVSHELHKLKVNDSVRISVPCGHFVLKEPKNNNPLVFVSLGVGVTPILPMASEAAAKYSNPISIIQGARNEDSICFSQEYEKLKESHSPRITYQEAFKQPLRPNEVTPTTVTPEWIWENSPADACFYFTGPSNWMQSLALFLREKGVPEENINFEFFGPTLQL